MDLIGIGYDWSREVNSSPDYYKWTQWIFLLLYKRGLAYRSIAPGELVPDVRDGARQRGSQGRPLLAVRLAHREEGPAAVVLQDHRLRDSG